MARRKRHSTSRILGSMAIRDMQARVYEIMVDAGTPKAVALDTVNSMSTKDLERYLIETRGNPVLRGGKPLPIHMRPWGWEITASGMPEEPGLKRIGKFFVYNLYHGQTDLPKAQRQALFQRVKSLLQKRKGWAFYMNDDDGNLMYRGKLYLPEGMSHPREGTEEILFAPLDWAAADVGATSIHYGWDNWRVL